MLAVVHLVLDAPRTEFEEVATRHPFVAEIAGRLILTEFITIDDVDQLKNIATHDVEAIERRTRLRVTSFDYDLVNISEIAERSGRSRQSVRQLVQGDRGDGTFPPAIGAPGGVRIWDWGTVNEWLRGRGLPCDPEFHPPIHHLEELNIWVKSRSQSGSRSRPATDDAPAGVARPVRHAR